MQGAVIQDNDSGSFLDLPFCSRGIENSSNKRRQKLFTAKDCSRFNSNAYQLKNHFSGDEIFYNIEDENDDIWNGNSIFFYVIFVKYFCWGCYYWAELFILR